MLLSLSIIIAYLLGSLSSAIIVSKLVGLPDPRTQGSGNPGATNIMRIGGKKLAIIVLLGDILKGTIPVVLAKLLGLPTAYLGWVALAAFIGHLYPVFFKFKGGKGVATAVGGIIAIAWPLALAALTTWAIIFYLFRYVSLASILAAVSVCIYAIWLAPVGTYLAILLMSLLLIAKHYQNIQRLLVGTEHKFKKS